MFTGSAFVTRLCNAHIAQPDQIRGCTDQEIRDIESRFGLRLPEAYRQFLRVAGHSAGGFWREVVFQLEKLEWINHEAREILRELEETRLELPKNAFVFSMRYGEQFMFFVADDGSEDPRVYHFCIGFSDFRNTNASFSEILEDELAELEQVFKVVPPGFLGLP